ncbi:MAG: hypothetical protein IT184_05825 [Acidobacteria bacterium]|nr:hypothetical protein [Acidobacteriota bacterium]
MPDAVFNLRVPAGADYRSLAVDVVARYFDLIGGAESERQALAAAFGRALDELVGATGTPGTIEVSCVGGKAGGELQLRCGGRSAVVRYENPRPQAAR